MLNGRLASLHFKILLKFQKVITFTGHANMSINKCERLYGSLKSPFHKQITLST